MRLVTFDPGDGPRAGLLLDDQVVAIEGARDVGDLLRAGPVSRVMATGEPTPVASVQLLPPVLAPSKIVCVGLNYGPHAAEAGLDPPETPTFFAKWSNALAPPGAEVPLPSFSEKVDYEAEVAFVIGYDNEVAGYTLFNDLSARDYQFKTPQWMPGKVFDGSAPCGPALVTPDEAGPHDGIEIELRLNGEVMQSATTADLIHSVPELVTYLSTLMTLEPGDLVATGTPSGVGSTRDPKVWLKPGDEIVISSPTLGVLETRLR